MNEKFNKLILRYEDLNNLLSTIDISKEHEKYLNLSKEHSNLKPIVIKIQEYSSVNKEIIEYELASKGKDNELKELAEEELPNLKDKLISIEKDIRLLLLPIDPNDEKDVILEIRAGTGGDEAAIFTADLFRMYSRHAETKRWKFNIISSNEIGLGGYKEIICQIQGEKVYSRLKYESGTHRVQRVPKTEAQGRVHTSAATVAVLPAAEEVDIDINPNDLRIDVYRSSGCGGQHVNTTDSAVRITHIPTNTVVTCQDEKSQHKNKAKALSVLRARVYEKVQKEEDAKRAKQRKLMVGSGDRSERIRTYNYPQGRITDHRINFTIYKLESFMNGDIDELINALTAEDQNELLNNQ